MRREWAIAYGNCEAIPDWSGVRIGLRYTADLQWHSDKRFYIR